ncbi:hypothetical protein OQA88_12584 [Cercophora sp. LCS_1]
MFGDTLRHIVARWAYVDSFWTLHEAADLRSINMKNIHGDTFMHILGPAWIETQAKALLDVLVASWQQGFNFLSRNLDGKNFLSCLLPPASSKMHTIQLHSLTAGLQYLLDQTPSHILIPSLLSQAPASQPQTVAHYMEQLLKTHAHNVTDHRTHIFALSVSQIFGDKVRAFPQTISPPLIPAPNAIHQHLQYLQHLEGLSITPWEAPGDLFRLFTELMDNGADPNEYEIYGTTAMTCTAAVLHHIGLGHLPDRDGVSILTLLHERGADLRLVTSEGETPLHMAIRLELPNAVSTLLKLGADPMALNTDGKPAIRCSLRQRALRRERIADSKQYAYAHRILVHMIDAVGKWRLQRPYSSLFSSE